MDALPCVLGECGGCAVSSYREAAEQALPTPGTQSVFAEVRRLLDAREAKGVATYGRTLETFNGRDAHQDGLEELLDGFLYRTQAKLERRELEAELTRVKAGRDETRADRDALQAQVERLRASFLEEKRWMEHYRNRVAELEAKLNTAPPPQGPRHDIGELLNRGTAAPDPILRCRDCRMELDPLTATGFLLGPGGATFLCPVCHYSRTRFSGDAP